MKNKIGSKIAAMRNSEKKGMEILGWLLTIVLGIAVVGIIWFFVQPSVSKTAGDASTGVEEDSTAIIESAGNQIDAMKTKTTAPK